MEHQNLYKGAPSRELDNAWEYLQHRNKSVVWPYVIDRIGKSRDAVSYPNARANQYYVDIEIFHQMRCLNLIRQYTYPDYYTQPAHRPSAFDDPAPVLRTKVDHCIDMLRQALLCQADVGIITADWVEQPPGSGRMAIVPDYSTEHKCRSFERVVQWADENAAPEGKPPRPEPRRELPV
ncbi:hypothetical protein F5144DRAFT_601890 [Chaetomium tenue]|uniref:Uncharacterized protein n=1 Tax=Chaetomium tenue TaxID=1854479 RepID=A0ACB7PDE5_9PEZI|nr:hypothetical protein F5144DRAFT_601890 [Chaetomium globosum]